MMDREVLRIITARGAGDATLRKITKHMDDYPGCTLTDICSDVNLMHSCIKISQKAAQSIYENEEHARMLEEQLYQNHVGMCWIGDDDFPESLKSMESGSAPAVLFYRGNFALLQKKSVGFTGSRKVSESGIRITDSAAGQLAAEGITVVSGYAKGVDITAHRAALQSGGSTIFVIVEGILKNRIKSEVKGLLDEENHLFLSQFSPNLPWSAANAMKRNGTIIGLSDAMLLIEAAMDGGTFHAGQETLKNGRPLFVVDYGKNKPAAEGNVFFLQHGGIPLRGDRNGNPVLKRVHAVLEEQDRKRRELPQGEAGKRKSEQQDSGEMESGGRYEQISLSFDGEEN